jgi:hypothetical protein
VSDDGADGSNETVGKDEAGGNDADGNEEAGNNEAVGNDVDGSEEDGAEEVGNDEAVGNAADASDCDCIIDGGGTAGGGGTDADTVRNVPESREWTTSLARKVAGSDSLEVEYKGKLDSHCKDVRVKETRSNKDFKSFTFCDNDEIMCLLCVLLSDS